MFVFIKVLAHTLSDSRNFGPFDSHLRISKGSDHDLNFKLEILPSLMELICTIIGNEEIIIL